MSLGYLLQAGLRWSSRVCSKRLASGCEVEREFHTTRYSELLEGVEEIILHGIFPEVRPWAI